ncbi:CBS domain-containing protein [Ornithinibacillus halotolerans]|uniref:CBS domain-containing protein n=1 Tax=Ornithinibacillus halotolerans TaxID=1274357 RepID=A0A916S7F2_9BACI|nr:CBS domain-containing protein [Ornithinibacillus halotolerans]GGA85259.1 hypothetical protein GCM10008025_30370 [Ornithinibacillus halotolerans]
MARNSERFITAFNRIDKAMDAELENSKGFGFAKSVRILTKYNAIVRKYKDDLLEFAELRNAIVHNRMDTELVIAEPHDSIVEKIEQIEVEMTKPKFVTPQFEKKVKTFDMKDTFTQLLDAIQEKGFSKFPVYNGREFKGLMTENGITKWLAKNKNKNKHVEDVLIEEILTYQKENNYQFISADTSVYEAVEVFKEQIGKGNRIDALLISKNGQIDETLIGIITAWDIMGIE